MARYNFKCLNEEKCPYWYYPIELSVSIKEVDTKPVYCPYCGKPMKRLSNLESIQIINKFKQKTPDKFIIND